MIKKTRSISDVINGGYCIGCGVCSSKSNKISIEFNNIGQYQAKINKKLSNEEIESTSKICPFSSLSKNEDQISEQIFHDLSKSNKKIGKYLDLYVGNVSEGNFREKGSSGGLSTWIQYQLLSKKEVDSVIHVAPSNNKKENLVKYSFANNINDLLNRSKSSYYPVEMSEIISKLKHYKGKVAIIGIPCFIKSMRLLSENDKKIKGKIKYSIAIMCGHLKSKLYADFLAWQKKIRPGLLNEIDFRRKVKGFNADDYGLSFKSISKNGKIEHKKILNRNLFGASWGYGFFMYDACNYCDDVMGETADITLGDAWLDNYKKDYKGNNVIVVRNKKINLLLKNGKKSKTLNIEKTSESDIIKSQLGAFRQRNDGLSYRLYLKDKKNERRPIKRITANNDHINLNEKRKFKLRMKLSQLSSTIFLEAIKRNDFNFFVKKIKDKVYQYDLLYRSRFRIFLTQLKKNLFSKIFYKNR